MERKLKWGIISTAQIGQNQLIPAIHRAKNAEVVAIASPNEKVQEVADRLHIPTIYSSYEELLKDTNIDAVYIPLPNHLHKEWVMKAADNGKHVLCEKPAALTEAETKEMVDYCRQRNVKFMEAFMYQFHPQHDRVKEIVAAGEIGEVKTIDSSFTFYLEDGTGNIRLDPNKGGGSLYDVGCYCIHVTRNVLGAEPVSVRVSGDLAEDGVVDTSLFAYMEMANGVHVTFKSSVKMAPSSEYEVIGTKGKITVPRAFRPDVQGGEGLIIVDTGSQQRTERIVADQYALQVEHFSEAVLTDTAPSYTAESTLANMRVIDACYKALKTGEIVKL
ncbi:Gfo/Idh/MocA family protein [Halalkalibacter urbisdiaboli]|uniref:Gfo/Idh/MocA family protein n=1 Tax=Halalkalibacter urbisdiaboli TaxID=1960589 RepID=UPI000B450853|nr:Gfo/Idh/MocA family oxidoreductase [Halalkalibacter urbisdiaboli]